MPTKTKSLARVLAPAIRVNAVAPAYVGTAWFETLLGAEDIAGPMAMLLDPAGRAITGETLLADAGAHLDTGLSRRPMRKR